MQIASVVLYIVEVETMGFPSGSSGKESPCRCRRCRRLRCDPWVVKIPWEGNAKPLQYSCLGNPTDRGSWLVTIQGSQRVWHEWIDGAVAAATETNVTETKPFADFLQQRGNRKNRYYFGHLLFTVTINDVIIQDTSVCAQTKQVSEVGKWYDRYTLLYLKQRANKDLMISSRNATQQVCNDLHRKGI